MHIPLIVMSQKAIKRLIKAQDFWQQKIGMHGKLSLIFRVFTEGAETQMATWKGFKKWSLHNTSPLSYTIRNLWFCGLTGPAWWKAFAGNFCLKRSSWEGLRYTSVGKQDSVHSCLGPALKMEIIQLAVAQESGLHPVIGGLPVWIPVLSISVNFACWGISFHLAFIRYLSGMFGCHCDGLSVMNAGVGNWPGITDWALFTIWCKGLFYPHGFCLHSFQVRQENSLFFFCISKHLQLFLPHNNVWF